MSAAIALNLPMDQKERLSRRTDRARAEAIAREKQRQKNASAKARDRTRIDGHDASGHSVTDKAGNRLTGGISDTTAALGVGEFVSAAGRGQTLGLDRKPTSDQLAGATGSSSAGSTPPFGFPGGGSGGSGGSGGGGDGGQPGDRPTKPVWSKNPDGTCSQRLAPESYELAEDEFDNGDDCVASGGGWACVDAGSGAVCAEVENGPYASKEECEAALVEPEIVGGQCTTKEYRLASGNQTRNTGVTAYWDENAPDYGDTFVGKVVRLSPETGETFGGQSIVTVVVVSENDLGETSSISYRRTEQSGSTSAGPQFITSQSYTFERVDGTSLEDDIAECGGGNGLQCP